MSFWRGVAVHLRDFLFEAGAATARLTPSEYEAAHFRVYGSRIVHGEQPVSEPVRGSATLQETVTPRQTEDLNAEFEAFKRGEKR